MVARGLRTIVLVRSSVARIVGRWALAAALLFAVVVTYTRFLVVNPTTVALTLLLLIQWLAATGGLSVAVGTSVAAALCFNYYFLPPVGGFTIADTQNWVALAAFLVTALIGSNLADRLQAARTSSERQGGELALLYDLGQRLLVPESPAELLRSLPAAITAAFRGAGAALFLVEGAQLHATPLAAELPLEQLRATALASRATPSVAPGSALVPLAVGVRPIGAIYLEFGAGGTVPTTGTLEAMSSLVALSIERAGAVEKLVHAQAAAESDRLRATLLDAVTHDLRTPLTSIKASVSSLLSQTGLRADQREELLNVIDEESDRLNRLIAQAVEMAQLDAGAVRLDRRAYPLNALIEEVLETARPRWPERTLLFDSPGAGKTDALIDAALVAKVLLHLLENAAKYSPEGTPITVTLKGKGKWLELAIVDQGPGISAGEQQRIFDKFYRTAAHRYRVPGTGMGLPIARAIVEAHGGTLTVESAPGHGSEFRFLLPRA